MSLIKKAALFFMAAAVIMLSFASCHGKGEIAMTIDGVEISAAHYLYFLVSADMNARQKLAAPDDEGNPTYTIPVDPDKLAKEVVDGETFFVHVQNAAMKSVKNYAAIVKKCEEFDAKMTDEEIANIKMYADYYWQQVGAAYQNNGVSKESYAKAMEGEMMMQALIKKLFDKGGVQAASEEEVKKSLSENFALANTLSVEWTTTNDAGESVSLTDEEKAEKKKTLEKFVERLNKGEKWTAVKADFDKAFPPAKTEEEETESHDETTSHDHDETAESSAEAVSSADTSSAAASSEAPKAKDETAVVFKSAELATAESGSESPETEGYAKLKALQVGKAELLELSASYMIVLKQDIMADAYYLDTNYFLVSRFLKQDDFTAEFNTFTESLKVNKNNFVLDNLSPRKLKY